MKNSKLILTALLIMTGLSAHAQEQVVEAKSSTKTTELALAKNPKLVIFTSVVSFTDRKNTTSFSAAGRVVLRIKTKEAPAPTTYTITAASANTTMGTVSGGGIYKDGAEVTLTATPAEGCAFKQWSDGTTANPYVFTATKDVVLTAMFKKYTQYITDGTEYTATESKFQREVVYTRTFNNTNWQALYVPFSMDYDEWSEKYDIAEIHNFIEYDDDDNGTFDRTYLVVLKKTSGSTEANYPYLIRAKETGTHNLVLQDKMLEAAANNSIDCRSVKNEYTFTGTYQQIDDMFSNGYYAMKDGKLQKASSSSVTLSPQRWYLSVTSRMGDATTKAQNIRILVDGEDDVEGLEMKIDNGRQNMVCFDLAGRVVRTTNNMVRGVNIVNGKKLIK